jgi:dihydroorotase
MAVAYKAELEALAPKVTFLMSLYLNPALTPDEIRKAAKAGVRGKMSPPPPPYVFISRPNSALFC